MELGVGAVFDLIEHLFLVIGEDLTHAFVGSHAFDTNVARRSCEERLSSWTAFTVASWRSCRMV